MCLVADSISLIGRVEGGGLGVRMRTGHVVD